MGIFCCWSFKILVAFSAYEKDRLFEKNFEKNLKISEEMYSVSRDSPGNLSVTENLSYHLPATQGTGGKAMVEPKIVVSESQTRRWDQIHRRTKQKVNI